MGAGDVRGGDGDEVAGTAAALVGGELPGARQHCAAATRDGPEQVDLDRLVEGGVEADSGGRVDRRCRSSDSSRRPVVVEAQAVVADVAGDGDSRRRPRASNRSPSSARRRSKQSFFRISWPPAAPGWPDGRAGPARRPRRRGSSGAAARPGPFPGNRWRR